jgi:uncharacterized protein
MDGYQVTFFTQQDRMHGGLPVAEWLMREAKRMKLKGATMVAATEGFGHDQKLHAARFFDLADQPVSVTMAITTDEAAQLFACLRAEKLNVFYVKIPIEFGMSEDVR